MSRMISILTILGVILESAINSKKMKRLLRK